MIFTTSHALSDEQRDLLDQLDVLDQEYATVIKDFYDRRDALMKQIAEKIPIGTMFQSEADNTVYEIVKPPGRFVHFEAIGYVRTRRGYRGETKAGLSLKRAQAEGFTLSENQLTVTAAQDGTP